MRFCSYSPTPALKNKNCHHKILGQNPNPLTTCRKNNSLKKKPPYLWPKNHSNRTLKNAPFGTQEIAKQLSH